MVGCAGGDTIYSTKINDATPGCTLLDARYKNGTYCVYKSGNQSGNFIKPFTSGGIMLIGILGAVNAYIESKYYELFDEEILAIADGVDVDYPPMNTNPFDYTYGGN